MDLSADQRKQLQEALLSAFLSKTALAQMVNYGLGTNLDDIAGGANNTEVVFNLIAWAAAQGRTAELIQGAYRENGGNPVLAAFVKALNLTPGQMDPAATRPIPLVTRPGNPFFGDSPQMLGRNQEVRRILEKLPTNHCSIVGPPGAGKTMLLRAVLREVPAQLAWLDGAVLNISFRSIVTLTDLQMEIVNKLGGTRVAQLRQLLTPRPLRLLALDDLGSMGTGKAGYDMRRLLRGWAESFDIRLLITSIESLDILFKDDTTGDSPLANLDPAPLRLAPLARDDCRALVMRRLAETAYTAADFADVLSVPRQPRELLRLCTQRYETLRGGP